MSIKGKIKSAWKRLTGSKAKQADNELGADEVVKKEVFPKSTAKKSNCKKPASKRTRPTNNDYQMVDPSGDTFDAGQS